MVLFSIVATAQQDVVVPSIIHPQVRMPGRIINLKSGQIIGSFEVDAPHLPVLPNPCDANCLMEEVGNNARDLGDELGSALADKLANFTAGGIPIAGPGPGPGPALPPPGPGPGPEAGLGGPPVLNGPIPVSPSAAGCEGLPGDIRISVRNFTPDELLEVERNLRQFGCFQAIAPIRMGSTFADYSYTTSAGTARLDRNLRVMLQYLGLLGQVSFDGQGFQVVKISTR